jgi:hypothetical protein
MLPNKELTVKILFFSTLILLLLPLAQFNLNYFEADKPLNGSFEKAQEPKMNPDEWQSGNFQKLFEKWFNQEFGFRNRLVRFNHQLEFSLFKTVSSPYIVIGKDRFLFEKGYIATYNGEDFVGYEKINEKLSKLNKVRDTLNKLGKEILIVIAPSKAAHYPEFLPKELISKKNITNREAYIQKMNETHTPYLDLAGWTYSLKGKTEYPLFPKTGLHWSNYMADKAADTLIKYIEQQKKIDLPEFRIKNTIWSDTLQDPDNDIENSLNLMFKIPNAKCAYSEIEGSSPEKNTHKILVIGDSFYWQIFNRWISRDYFMDGKFWYYNKQSYPETWWGAEVLVEKLDLNAEINQREAIVIFQTEQNMNDVGWGVIEKMYDLYYKK